MSNVLTLMSSLWLRFLAGLLSISVRRYLVVVALLLSIAPFFRFSSLGWLDSVALNSVSSILGFQQRSQEVGLVLLKEEQLQSWQRDAYAATGLTPLISNILHSSDASIGFISNDPFVLNLSELELYISGRLSPESESSRMLQKKYYLRSLLNDERVALGYRGDTAIVLDNAEFALEKASYSDKSDWKKNIFDSVSRYWGFQCERCEGVPILVDEYRWYPVAETEGQYVTGLDEVRSFSRAVVESKKGVLEKVDRRVLGVSQLLGVNLGAQFISAYHLPSSPPLRLSYLSYDEALQLNAFPNYVLIGSSERRALLEAQAEAVLAFDKEHYFFVPWWSEFLARLLFFLVVLYFLFFHFSIKKSLLRMGMVAFFGVGVLAAVFVFALVFKAWLPVSHLYTASMFFFVLSSAWFLFHQRENHRRKEWSSVVSGCGVLLENGQHYEEAISLYAQHPNKIYAIESVSRQVRKLENSDVSSNNLVFLLKSIEPFVVESKKHQSHFSQLLQSVTQKNALLKEVRKTQAEVELPQKLGRYEIERELGRGAVGIVYLGFDPAIARHVAVKTLDVRTFTGDQHEGLKSRFFREAEAAGRLSHPNIISVFDVGEDDQLAYIAMDYIEGVPLSEHVQSDFLLPVAQVFRIVLDVATALHYAHQQQIVHRDVKPGNIMYCAEPYSVKVADFGIARLLDNSKTTTGEILGSPLYMSPEQLKGSKVGPEADLFSLGVTFYQLLCGELPFNADNLASLTYEIIHTKHKNIRSIRKDLPASAARIVNQCLQKTASDRYESAWELALVLRKAIKRDFPEEAKQWGI